MREKPGIFDASLVKTETKSFGQSCSGCEAIHHKGIGEDVFDERPFCSTVTVIEGPASSDIFVEAAAIQSLGDTSNLQTNSRQRTLYEGLHLDSPSGGLWQRSLSVVGGEHLAQVGDFPCRLGKPPRKHVAQLARAVGKAVQHLEKQRARDEQHARRLKRRRGCGPRALGEERHLAQ